MSPERPFASITPATSSRPASPPSRSTSPPSRPAILSSRPATPSSRPATPSSRPATPSSRPATPSSRSTAPASSSTEADITTGQKGKKEWPRQYKLPKENIAKGITTKLDNKEDLTTGERRILLETIYNDVTKYKGVMYPTSEMYEEITDGLIREYPHLLSSGGLPATSARAYWKDKIIFKEQGRVRAKFGPLSKFAHIYIVNTIELAFEEKICFITSALNLCCEATQNTLQPLRLNFSFCSHNSYKISL